MNKDEFLIVNQITKHTEWHFGSWAIETSCLEVETHLLSVTLTVPETAHRQK